MVLTAQQRVKNLKMFYLGPKLFKKQRYAIQKKKVPSAMVHSLLT